MILGGGRSKKCKNELARALTLLWQKSFESGIIPLSLKQSPVTPIHKGGNKSKSKNYRPVALTSHFIKIFEKILKKRMVNFLESNNLFNPGQHGFRKGRSCLSELLLHYDEILAELTQNKNVDVAYLDFAKAFDKVDFGVLLNKLYKLGIRGKILKWIESFLKERTLKERHIRA